MKRIAFLLTLLSVSTFVPARAQKIGPADFTYEEIYSGNGMTAIDFDATGRMFVCEKQGRVLVFGPDGKGGFAAPTVFADLRAEVNPDNESGLLGIAIDPRFAINRYIYVFSTGNTDQKLVRLTADESLVKAAPNSALVLLQGLPRTATNHKAGDIHIHPLDPKAIYLVLGDDTHRELVSDLSYYNGKLLRLDKATGKGLADNPFYDGNVDSVRSRVWARGFRNPFRFAFLPGGHPDCLYGSETGDGTDRVARIPRGADAGWGRDGDKGLIHPADPNVSVLYTSKPCLTAIAIATKGPFAPDGPTLLSENWFSQDFKRWDLTGSRLDQLTPLPVDAGTPLLGGFKFVSCTFGPDGALYLVQTYYAASVGHDHKLSRIVPRREEVISNQ